MPTRARWLSAVVTTLFVVITIARFAVAGTPVGSVHCCCGTHLAAHDCGCPECPSHGHMKKHAPSSHDTIRSCAGGSELAAPSPLPPFVVPVALAALDITPVAAVVAPPVSVPPDRVVEIVVPPS